LIPDPGSEHETSDEVFSENSSDEEELSLCTLRVVNGKGALLAVAAPSQTLPGPIAPQAMIYQARFKGQAGQGNQGFTEVNTEATVLIDTGATQDFVGQRYVQRHDLRTLPARKMTDNAW
jgi:hypothetical protein